MNILVAVQGCVQVEVGNVKDCKPGTFARDKTVAEDLDKFRRAGGGTDVAWVADLVAANGDASAFLILLVVIDFADNFGVGDFVSLVSGEVLVVDD